MGACNNTELTDVYTYEAYLDVLAGEGVSRASAVHVHEALEVGVEILKYQVQHGFAALLVVLYGKQPGNVADEHVLQLRTASSVDKPTCSVR